MSWTDDKVKKLKELWGKGSTASQIANIIGEDELEVIDLESVSFIVGILNELNTINLRNEILLKVLPLKV